MRKLFGILLSFVLVLLLIPALGKTARAETTLNSRSKSWDEDCIVEDDVKIEGGVSVNANIKLEILEGKTLTVIGGIDAEGWTLTVEGKGKLVVEGTNGSDGGRGDDCGYGENSSSSSSHGDGSAGGPGGPGGDGFTGDLVVNGADVTVSGGTGGTGGDGGWGGHDDGNGGRGGTGGDGGKGISGTLTVNSGFANVTGGKGGSGGEGGTCFDFGDGGDGGDGGVGAPGLAGTLTVNSGLAIVTGGAGGSGGSSMGNWYGPGGGGGTGGTGRDGGTGVTGSITMNNGSVKVTGGSGGFGGGARPGSSPGSEELYDGGDGGHAGDAGNGGTGVTGEFTINSGTAFVTGGKGGDGDSGGDGHDGFGYYNDGADGQGGDGGNGSNGGDGGKGIDGTLKVMIGTATVTGGGGGSGGKGGTGGRGLNNGPDGKNGNNGSNGSKARAVTGAITGSIVEESDDNSSWSAISSGSSSSKQYVKAETPIVLTLAPASATDLIVDGDAVKLTASVSPDNASNKKVKWSVSEGSDKVELYTDSNCSTRVGPDATDKLTVYAKGTAAGTATITVTSIADNTKSAACAVTVTEPGSVEVSKEAEYDRQKHVLLYTVTIKSSGKNTKVVMEDTIIGSNVTLDGSSISCGSSTGRFISPDIGGTGNKFILTIDEMSDGETIEVSYLADVDTSALTMSEGRIVTQADNVVTVRSDSDTDNPPFKLSTVLDFTPTVTKDDALDAGLNGTIRYQEWTVYVVCNGLSAAGLKITDTIAPDSQSVMKYSGEGITVKEQDVNGQVLRTYNIPWSQFGQKPDSTWTYEIPQSDAETLYRYKITYLTEAEAAGLTEDTTVKNGAALEGGSPVSGTGVISPVRKEHTPAATFKATDSDSGRLSNVTDGMKFRIDDGEWTDITSDSDIDLTGLSRCTIQVVKKGNGTTTIDSDVQEIKVTKAEKPTDPVAADCTIPANNDGRLTGVTSEMEYRKSDAAGWTEGTGDDITGLVPGTYYVRMKPNGTVLASGNQELTVKKYISATVTFKVKDGSWDDGEGDAATADRTVALQGWEGDTLKLREDQIPSAGSRPKDSTFMAGDWVPKPDTSAGITQDTVYTYKYAKKKAAEVTKVPTALNLTYNEKAQDLVAGGEASGGELRYAVRKDDHDPPSSADEYSAGIPAGTDAGTYYVWYKVFADDTHLDSAETCFAVTISPGTPSGGASGHDDGLTYTGEAQELVLPGTVQGGTMLYALGSSASTPPGDSSFGPEIPKGTDAGTYYVWYRIMGDGNHNDVPPGCLTAVIKKAPVTPVVSITGWTYGKAASSPEVDPQSNPGNGAVSYEYSREKDTGYTDRVPVQAGPWFVRALVAETKNYKEAVSKPLGFAIARASITITADDKSGTFGEDLKALTYTVDGAYVEGDDLGVSFTCTVKKNSDVGTYPITVSWNENKNYDAQLVDGTYTVRKAVIDTASAGNSGKPAARSGLTYKGKNQKLLSAPAKLPDGCAKMQYRMSGTASWSNSIPAAAKAGTYTMEYRYVGDKNHKNSAAFRIKASIARAKITITAQDKTGPRETAIQKLTWKVTGAYVSGDNLGIKASTTAKKTSKPGKYKISVSWNKNPNYTATLKNGNYTITDRVTGPEKARTGISLNSGFRAWWEGSGLMVSWGKAENAGRYDVLAAYCGKDAPKPVRTVIAKSEPVIKITSLDGSKIDRTKNIKVRVIAYRKVDGQYTRMGATLIAHVTGGQGRISGFTNARRVTVQKDSYTLKTGKTAVVRATTIPEVKGKKLLGENHAARYRYASDNKAVATVDENGKITAVGKGTCHIYVYAQNGTSKKVSVMVK